MEPTFSNVFLYQIVQMRLINGQLSRAEGYDLRFVVIGTSNIVTYFRKASARNQADISTANHRNSQDSDLPSMTCPANNVANHATLPYTSQKRSSLDEK